MTTQASFSDKRSPNRRFFNGRFFRFQLKTGWPLLVVFIFVFVLSIIVPSVSYIGDMNDNYEFPPTYYTQGMLDETVEFLYMMGTWNVVISMFGGFLCGLTAMRFVNNKVAVNFYHSLPMRRESLFTTSTLQTFLYYVIAFVAALAISFGAFAFNFSAMTAFFISPAALTLVYGVLFFFLVYAMTLFAASLTGTGLMRFIGAVYVIGLPLVTFVLFVISVGSLGMYESILDVDYYMSAEFLIPLCAPLRLINLAGENADGDYMLRGIFNKETLIVLLTALVFYGLAFLLYCIRPSESASKPVIWRPAAFVFKYVSMFLAATLFALMFYGIFYESMPWMIFGLIIGTLIVFMLTNGILNKSARAIFKGIRGLVIFGVVMAVITVVFYIDVFGIFASIPSGSLVNRAQICLEHDIEAEYKGDFASKVTNIIGRTHEKQLDINYDGGYYILTEDKEVPYEAVELIYKDGELPNIAQDMYSGYNYDSMSVEAVFHTKLGIPYAVRIYPNCEQVYELAQFIADTNKDALALPDKELVDHGYIELYMNDHTTYDEKYELYSFHSRDYNADEIYSIAQKLSDPTGMKNESPIVGIISLYVNKGGNRSIGGFYYNNGKYTNLFIHANDYEALNDICNTDYYTCEEDFINYYMENNTIRGIYVVDNDENEGIYITDTEKLRSMFLSLSGMNSYNDPAICGSDHRYNVFVYFEGNDSEYCDYTYEFTFFRNGAVPAFVTELFSGAE